MSYEIEMKEQIEWLLKQAITFGYKDIQDMLTRDMPRFIELSTRWRRDHVHVH